MKLFTNRQSFLYVSISFIFVFIISFITLISPVHAESNPILFWGEGCPHCENVKEAIKEKNIDKTLTIDYKEVYYDQDARQLFFTKLQECRIETSRAGVPSLYLDGKCYSGENEVMDALEEKVKAVGVASNQDQKINNENGSNDTEGSTDKANRQINNNALSKGEKNTIIMLISVFTGMVSLVILGYALQGRKSKELNIIPTGLIITTSMLIATKPVSAVCPVCTVAVGAGLGLSRYLGIDDVITSLWIGALIVSTIFWMIDWMGKKNIKGLHIDLLTTIITYALVIIPLYWKDVIGHPLNTLWGVDKIMLGTTIGSIVFLIGAQVHFALKTKNKGKVLFPFQKVVIPVSSIWLASLLFYFIVY